MAALPRRITLRDGRELAIRPIAASDRDTLHEAFTRLSPESRYRRFFGPMPELSDRDLDYLTVLDHRDHEALLALDPATGLGVAVARYVRVGPAVAEPAVVVADDWQGRGVGSAILDALVQRAEEEGVSRFEAPVLASNEAAVRLLEGLGETTKVRSGREVTLSIELPGRQATVGDGRWRRILRVFATGALAPGRTLFERLSPQRPGSPGDDRLNVIVVGTDGSEDSRRAVEAAGSLAMSSGAQLEVVGVHRFLTGDAAELAATVGDAAAQLRAQGLAVTEHVRRGDPALVLADLADELSARLIVVGVGQRSKGARRLIGSTSDSVAERSPCDVLIVRPPRARRSGGD